MAEQSDHILTLARRVVGYLSRRFAVSDAILFGSYANGVPGPYSDVDLAIVSPDFVGQRMSDRVELRVKVQLECAEEVELHPLTPSAVANARPSNFVGHILKTGKYLMKDGKWLV